jgi:hypothetical protein
MTPGTRSICLCQSISESYHIAATNDPLASASTRREFTRG